MTENAKAPKKTVDWEAIERDYRAGIKSLRCIAAAFGITEGAIRKRAKAEKWERDLSAKVQEAVRNKLVREQVRIEARAHSQATDKQIIEEAAATAVEVVRSHRKSISHAQRLVQKMLGELEDASDNQDDIKDDIIEETKSDTNQKRRNAMLRAVDLPSRSNVMVNLSNAMTKLVMLERQAFNIADDRGDDAPSDTPVLDGMMKELSTLRNRMEATSVESLS